MRDIGIFYISLKPGRGRVPLTLPGKTRHQEGPTVYIRTEMRYTGDLLQALDNAAPRRGESVMNTHWVK